MKISATSVVNFTRIGSYFIAISKFNILQQIRQRLNRTAIQTPSLARRLCQLIPAHCPFERNVQIFKRNFYIPSLCKLNPLYEELMALRFRALSYLADECGEDVTQYCINLSGR
ncbi:Mo-dependent nitrogenase C-terminal domain-containing protein [Gloeocapsopsis crepidinum]|nr:Mo-dependent nitrogenase C-terminal domain-containing protein [Gloeocapsopsis crepidinum]